MVNYFSPIFTTKKKIKNINTFSIGRCNIIYRSVTDTFSMDFPTLFVPLNPPLPFRTQFKSSFNSEGGVIIAVYVMDFSFYYFYYFFCPLVLGAWALVFVFEMHLSPSPGTASYAKINFILLFPISIYKLLSADF